MVRGPPGLRPRLPPRRPRHGRHPEAEAAFCAAFGATFPVRLGIALMDIEGAWAWGLLQQAEASTTMLRDNSFQLKVLTLRSSSA
jgi:hypothetical protein